MHMKACRMQQTAAAAAILSSPLQSTPLVEMSAPLCSLRCCKQRCLDSCIPPKCSPVLLRGAPAEESNSRSVSSDTFDRETNCVQHCTALHSSIGRRGMRMQGAGLKMPPAATHDASLQGLHSSMHSNAVQPGMNAVWQRLNAVRKGLNAVRKGLNAVRQGLNAVRKGLNAVRQGLNERECGAQWS
eukprot:349912-Chlamydomonas_euryale.AAC.6